VSPPKGLTLAFRAALGAGILPLPLANADPGFWRRVAEPERAVEQWRWVKAQRDRVVADAFGDARAAALGAARALLRYEIADGTRLLETRLMFLLGRSLIAAGGEYQEQGLNVLREALQRFGDEDSARGAWFDVGLTASQLGQLELSEMALRKSLEEEWQEPRRVRALLELAAIHMRQEQLRLAIGEYRVALQDARGPEGRALARWGLGVALDRDHDYPAALPHLLAAAKARFGNMATLGVLELPQVQLHPRHEVYYYRALGQMAVATEQEGTPLHVSSLQGAQLMWLSYVQAAKPTDPWLPQARQHLARVRRELSLLVVEEDPEDSAQQPPDLEWMR
jgi:tetratricopeptide (TPR) repeat protein